MYIGKGKFSEEKFIEYIEEKLDSAIENCKHNKGYFDQLWFDYRDIKKESTHPIDGGSNFSNPITSTIADATIPRIIEDILDIETPIQLKCVNRSGFNYRDAVQKFHNWDLETRIDRRQELYDFVLNTVVYGVGFGECYFYAEKDNVVVMDETPAYIVDGKPLEDENGNLIMVTDEVSQVYAAQGLPFTIDVVFEKKKKWLRYHPEFWNIDPRNVYWPKDVTGIKDGWNNSCLFIKDYKTKDFLMRQLKGDKKKLYRNINKAIISEFDTEFQTSSESSVELIDKYTKTKKIPIYKGFVNYDVDGDGYDEHVVILYNKKSKKLLGYEIFPYEHNRCPLVAGYIRKLPNKVIGVGVSEMMYDIKAIEDELINGQINRMRMNQNPILMYKKKETGFDERKHKYGFGKKWDLENITPDYINFLNFPSESRDIESMHERLQALAQKRSGINDYSLGMESNIASNKTARGIEALIQEGSILIRHMTRTLTLSIQEIMQQQLDLYNQFWGNTDDPEVIEWVRQIVDSPDNPLGDEPIEALKQKFNVFVTASKQDKRSQIIKAQFILDLLANDPYIQEFPEKIREATINLMRWSGVRDPEEWYPTIDELREFKIQIEMEAQRRILAEQQQIAVQEAAKEQQFKAENKAETLSELANEAISTIRE